MEKKQKKADKDQNGKEKKGINGKGNKMKKIKRRGWKAKGKLKWQKANINQRISPRILHASWHEQGKLQHSWRWEGVARGGLKGKGLCTYPPNSVHLWRIFQPTKPKFPFSGKQEIFLKPILHFQWLSFIPPPYNFGTSFNLSDLPWAWRTQPFALGK